jgi:hypothetical protein
LLSGSEEDEAVVIPAINTPIMLVTLPLQVRKAGAGMMRSIVAGSTARSSDLDGTGCG